jgi:hypothetical protein
MKLGKGFLIFILAIAAQGFSQEGPWGLGAHFVLSLPQSDFANLSKDGEGLGGKALYRPGVSKYFALRADLAYISYGEKRKDMAMSMGYYRVEIRNESFQLTMGPQFSLPLGAVSFYTAPMAGLYNYRTVASVPDAYYYYGYAISETTASLTKWGWNVNAGALIDVGIGVIFDLMVRYQKINDAVETTIDEKKQSQDASDLYIGVGVMFYLKKKF